MYKNVIGWQYLDMLLAFTSYILFRMKCIERPDIGTHTWLIDFQKRCKSKSWGKKDSLFKKRF